MDSINTKIIFPVIIIGVASASLYIAYKMYLKNKYVEPGTGKAADPGKEGSWFGSGKTTPPQIGIKGIDFDIKGVATGQDKLTNRHTGRIIYIYCNRRKYDDKPTAIKDRNKCTKWKVGSGATEYSSRRRVNVIQTAYRMTL